MAETVRNVEESVASQRRLRRTRIGTVEADARDKTIRVRIERLMKHAKYGKYQRRKAVFHAHDETNEAKAGDQVEIMECRPISKTKSWRLVQVLRRGMQVERLEA